MITPITNVLMIRQYMKVKSVVMCYFIYILLMEYRTIKSLLILNTRLVSHSSVKPSFLYRRNLLFDVSRLVSPTIAIICRVHKITL